MMVKMQLQDENNYYVTNRKEFLGENDFKENTIKLAKRCYIK